MITYPIQNSDRFTVYDTDAGEPFKDGRGRPMTNVKWGSLDDSQMIPNLAPNTRWLLNIKEERPTYNQWTEKLEKTTTYDVNNETATEGWSVVALTQQEVDNKIPANYETAGGIKLGVEVNDQNAFVRMNSLIDISNMPGGTTITLKDVYGGTHDMTVNDYKAIMVLYGQYCYALFLAE